jgi:hypothetical protein
LCNNLGKQKQEKMMRRFLGLSLHPIYNSGGQGCQMVYF